MLPSFDQSSNEEDEWGMHSTAPEEEESSHHSSQDLRQMANVAFASNDLDSAVPLYSMAIDKLMEENENLLLHGDPNQDEKLQESIDNMVILLSNRSVCLFKMESYQEAKVDAEQAWNISKESNPKAAFRLGKALLALRDYDAAIKVLNIAILKLKINASSEGNDTHEKDRQVMTHELKKLLQSAHASILLQRNIPQATATELSKLTSIIHLAPNQIYQPSIRHFEKLQELGEGNYSQVIAVKHLVTGEHFALKILEKKRVETLAKRQHPNVYNEIEMEKLLLGKRLLVKDEDEDKEPFVKGRRRIVNLYHTFQDYNNMYYLMDLPTHNGGGDMWSTIRSKGNKMVGTYPSLARVHLFQLLEALEFIHARGVVHRDLKVCMCMIC